MSWTDASDITENLAAAAQSFDQEKAQTLCQHMINRLWQNDAAFPEAEAYRCLRELRDQRFFTLMQRLADALIQTGQDLPQIRRQYAQSLLEQRNFTSAIAVLHDLEARTAHLPKENAEARGLLGRAYKQLYIDARESTTARSRDWLNQAVAFYYDVYKKEPELYLWHGVNAMALLSRAERDGIALKGFPGPGSIAQAIRTGTLIENLDRAAHRFGYAGKAEACIALGLPEEASGWMSRYVSSPEVNAFELGSTHRQLTEVWQLDMNSDMGSLVLPVLRSRLLDCSGSQVEMAPSDLNRKRLDQMAGQKHFEKVLGDTQYVTFNWYQRGLERCRAVARIETELETDRGEGTGFLVRGGDLKESWGDQRLLLTNAHVVSNDVNVKGALRPEKARISFKALGSGQTRYRIKQLLWTSPPSEFDATLIEMDGVPSDVETYPLSPVLPTLDEGERVYIIGHPKGGTLSFSINDNRLLDYQDRWIHYRAPTEGGSSGSPVFNRDWELIALHHAGGLDIPKLNNKEGNYAANEGIWIQAIRKALE